MEAILRIVDYIAMTRDRALTLASLDHSAVTSHLGLAITAFERPSPADTSEALPTRADTVQVHSLSAVGGLRVDLDPRPHIDPTLAFAVQGPRKTKTPGLSQIYAELLGHAGDETLATPYDDQGGPDGGGGGVAGSGGPGGSGSGSGGCGSGQAWPASFPNTAPGSDDSNQATARRTLQPATMLAPNALFPRHLVLPRHVGRTKAADDIDHADEIASARLLQNQDRAFRGTTMYAVLVELGLPIVWVTTAEMDTALVYTGTPVDSRHGHSMSDWYSHFDLAGLTRRIKPHPDMWNSRHESNTTRNVNASVPPLDAC